MFVVMSYLLENRLCATVPCIVSPLPDFGGGAEWAKSGWGLKRIPTPSFSSPLHKEEGQMPVMPIL